MDVVTIKLLTGEEIVGRQVSITHDQIVLKKPVRIHVDIDQQTGQPAIYPVGDFLYSVDHNDDVIIWRNAIAVGPMATRKEIADPYVKATSSIINPTSNNKIILT